MLLAVPPTNESDLGQDEAYFYLTRGEERERIRPPRAFIEAFNLVEKDGRIAFNIKETFLERSDTTGFSKFIRELIFSEYIDLYELKRYRHRYSIEGGPLFYYAVAGRKNRHISPEMLATLA